MLVLSIKVGEELEIGGAKVKIVRVGKTAVRIGIEAPQEIRILRGSVADRIRKESEAA